MKVRARSGAAADTAEARTPPSLSFRPRPQSSVCSTGKVGSPRGRTADWPGAVSVAGSVSKVGSKQEVVCGAGEAV
eukprot:1160829-Pelagomonas_calceolata.AAC.5